MFDFDDYLHAPSCSIKSHPLYSTWINMKYRCQKYGSASYKNYGFRGIKVCERWDKSFFHFVSDIGLKPGAKYSLDRVDNDGDYSPDNCRWATSKEQNNNRRTNRQITFEGQTKTITEWTKHFGVNQSTIDSLSHQYGLNTALKILQRYSQ